MLRRIITCGCYARFYSGTSGIQGIGRKGSQLPHLLNPRWKLRTKLMMVVHAISFRITSHGASSGTTEWLALLDYDTILALIRSSSG